MENQLARNAHPSAPGHMDQYLELPGLKLRFIEAGSGDPVILVHGYISSIEEQWLETGVFSHLAGRFHVFAYDNRGHGKSDKFHDPESYGIELVRDLFRFMDGVGLKKAHVVGYSMGANIVARALAGGHGRFLSATLAGAAGRYSISAEERARLQQEAAAVERGDATGHLLRMWPSDQSKPPHHDLKFLSDKVLAGKDLKSLAAIRRSMQPLVVSMDDFARCVEPVLGIIGTRDPHLGNMEALKARMPQLQLVKIPGGTHANLPGTAAFKTEVAAFISSNEDRGKP